MTRDWTQQNNTQQNHTQDATGCKSPLQERCIRRHLHPMVTPGQHCRSRMCIAAADRALSMTTSLNYLQLLENHQHPAKPLGIMSATHTCQRYPATISQISGEFLAQWRNLEQCGRSMRGPASSATFILHSRRSRGEFIYFMDLSNMHVPHVGPTLPPGM